MGILTKKDYWLIPTNTYLNQNFPKKMKWEMCNFIYSNHMNYEVYLYNKV